MTTRTALNATRSGLDRLRADFGRLDQARAIAEIRRLADAGFDEAEVVRRSGWSLADVRRALDRSTGGMP